MPTETRGTAAKTLHYQASPICSFEATLHKTPTTAFPTLQTYSTFMAHPPTGSALSDSGVEAGHRRALLSQRWRGLSLTQPAKLIPNPTSPPADFH